MAFLVLGFWTEDPSEAFSESCAFGGSPTGGCFCECLFTSVVHLSVVSVLTGLSKFNMDAHVAAIRALSLFTFKFRLF